MHTLHTTSAGASASDHDFASLSEMQGAPAILFDPSPQQLRPRIEYMTSVDYGERREPQLHAWQANRLHQATPLPRWREAMATT